MTAPFWKTKTLAEMDDAEWESLCDGCGRCCLNKIEDEDTGELFFTNAACRLLDIEFCRCRDYGQRAVRVPDCLNIRVNFTQFHWLPTTCAYRLLREGASLPEWHPLLTQDCESVHRAGVSVRRLAVCEDQVEDLADHVVEWLS